MLDWVFNLYDADRDGYISRQELTILIKAVNDLLGPGSLSQEVLETIEAKVNSLLNVSPLPLFYNVGLTCSCVIRSRIWPPRCDKCTVALNGQVKLGGLVGKELVYVWGARRAYYYCSSLKLIHSNK